MNVYRGINVEVTLSVSDQSISYQKVEATLNNVKKNVMWIEDVERVFVTTALQSDEETYDEKADD